MELEVWKNQLFLFDLGMYPVCFIALSTQSIVIE